MAYKDVMIYNYSSAQVNIPDFLAEKIIKWGIKNVPEKYLYTSPDDISYGRESEPHVTLLYGIHTDDPTEIRMILKNEKSFFITLQSISTFTSNQKYDVIKIDVKSPGLIRLHKKLSLLKHTTEFTSYCPHVTIAYVKKNKIKNLDGRKDFFEHKINVHEVIFSSRSGKAISILLETQTY